MLNTRLYSGFDNNGPHLNPPHALPWKASEVLASQLKWNFERLNWAGGRKKCGELWTVFTQTPALQKQAGCFHHIAVTLVADKLERQWLPECLLWY